MEASDISMTHHILRCTHCSHTAERYHNVRYCPYCGQALSHVDSSPDLVAIASRRRQEMDWWWTREEVEPKEFLTLIRDDIPMLIAEIRRLRAKVKYLLEFTPSLPIKR